MTGNKLLAALGISILIIIVLVSVIGVITYINQPDYTKSSSMTETDNIELVKNGYLGNMKDIKVKDILEIVECKWENKVNNIVVAYYDTEDANFEIYFKVNKDTFNVYYIRVNDIYTEKKTDINKALAGIYYEYTNIFLNNAISISEMQDMYKGTIPKIT